MNEQLRTPKGIYHDQIIYADGQQMDYGWRSNIVVDRCRTLLTAFMRGDVDVEPGIRYLALGRGISTWDDTPPSPPVAGALALTDSSPEIITVGDPAMTLAYLDTTGSETTTPGNCLQITLTIASGMLPTSSSEPTYPLREFGLFGRYDSADYMIDYVRHPVINISPTDTLVRRIRLVF